MGMRGEYAPDRFRIVTVPRLSPTKVSYDYPSGGLDPFDVDEPRTQHLYEACGWSRAWVAGEAWALWSAESRATSEVIPLQYRSHSLLEKLAVVVNGIVLREWPETPQPAYALWREVERAQRSGARRESWMLPYRLIRQNGNGRNAFDVYEDAIATAVRPSPQAVTWLVCRVLAHHVVAS